MADFSMFAQISPGELSLAHAHLEGISNCTKCHIKGERGTSPKCLACHKEIQERIQKKRGYHASDEVRGKDCHTCHGEHFGRDFKIIRFEPLSFDHSLSGYLLQGKHKSLGCRECHSPVYIRENISQKKRGETFLGLETTCVSCHEDFHQNTLDGACISCHDQNSFRPAPGFNHAKTDFPLLGKHAMVACVDCHRKGQQNGKNFQFFADTDHAGCTSCHKDVHNNKFGSDCKKCHDENAFKSSRSLSSFNHELTGFPLKGKHILTQCVQCHKRDFSVPVKHKRCDDCHADYHENQFKKEDFIPDCKECHTEEGFKPSTYGLEKHNQADFVLDGAHLATPCLSCHLNGDKWNFRFQETGCMTCHKNVHRDFSDSGYFDGGKCKTCHSTDKWNEITFDHDKTQYPLLGSHVNATCRECHFRETKGGRIQQYKGVGESCENCHQDIHYGQFEHSGSNACERCHTFNNWSPDRFSHDNTRFALDGRHVNLKCIQCHFQKESGAKKYYQYKFKDITCASCHS